MNKRVVFVLLFIVGLVSVLGGRAYYVQKTTPTFVPKNISYQINPPSSALEGHITQGFSDVKKFSRTSIDFEPTKTGEKVLLGEKIATGEDGEAVVEFKDFAKITFTPKSEAAFVETNPSQFSIRQSRGNLTYEGAEKPIFVRSMHLLISLTGKASVNIDSDNGQITVNITSGTATLGMKDNDNNTHKWDLKKGQRAVIDDESRTVKIF